MNIERTKYIPSKQFNPPNLIHPPDWKVWIVIDNMMNKLKVCASIDKDGVWRTNRPDNHISFRYHCISEKQAWFLFYSIKTESDVYKYLG